MTIISILSFLRLLACKDVLELILFNNTVSKYEFDPHTLQALPECGYSENKHRQKVMKYYLWTPVQAVHCAPV